MNPLKDNSEDRAADRFALIQKLGLEYSAKFMPFSMSRNSAEKNPSLNWKVTIKRGNQSMTTDYMQGVAHIPMYSHQHSRLVVYDNAVREACETGKSRLINHKSAYDAAQGERMAPRLTVIPAPRLEDVLYSLVLDASVLDSPTYEDWAGEFGYDVDSRKGEATYRACLEIALKMRAILGNDNLETLRDLFQDY